MHVLGIYEDGERIKGAFLRSSGKKITILFLEESKKDPLSLQEIKKKSGELAKGKSYETVSALSTEEVFLRKIELPIKSRRALFKALPFQMEGLLPFENEYGSTFPKIEIGKLGARVSLYSFLNDSLQNHLDRLQGLGVDPDFVFSVPSALLRFAKRFGGGGERELVFHIGLEKSHILYIEKGEIQKYATVEGAGKILQEIPPTKYADLASLQKEVEKQQGGSRMGTLFFTLRKEIHRVLGSIKRQKEDPEPMPAIFTGNADLGKALVLGSEEFPLEARSLLPHLEYSTEDLADHAIEIGLALEALEGDVSLQFRQGSFTAERQLTQRKKKVRLFLSSVLLSCTMGCIATTLFFAKKAQESRERFLTVAEMSGSHLSEYREVVGLFPGKKNYGKAVERLLKKVGGAKEEESFSAAPPLSPYIVTLLSASLEIKEIVFAMEEEKLWLTLEAPGSSEEEVRKFLTTLPLPKGTEGTVVTKKGNDVYQATYTLKTTS